MKIDLSPALVRQYVIVTIVNLGVLTTGMSLGWSSPVIVKLRNGTDTPLSRPITEEEGSWIISGGYLVVIGINFLGGILLDRLGLKYCFILVSVPKLLLAIWTIFVTEVWMLILCRVIMVVCDCFVLVVVPVYASEIACKEHRGSLGTFLNIFLCLGTVLILSIGPFLSYAALNYFIAAFIAVTTIPVIFLPDSPFHLYNKGRIDDAIKILSLIRDSDKIIQKELEDYNLSSKERNIDKMALWKNRLFMKALLLGLLLCAGSNLIVNLGVLTTGMSLGWSSPVIVKLRNGTDTPLSRPITEEEGSWIISGGYLVVIGINFLGGILLDRLGLKYCFILVSVPKLLLAIWTIFVTEVWMLILCRVIMVVCDCFVLVVVPVYASEIACKEHRGSLGTFLNIFLCLGTVLILSIGPFLSYAALNYFIAAFIAVTTIPVIFLPDSPFHLYNKGRIDDAIKILSLIRDSDKIIQKELEDYNLSSKERNIDKMALWKNRLFMKALLLGLLLCAGSNLIGYLALSFYLQTILESTKTSLRSDIASAILAGIQLFGAICSPFITQKMGRRTILSLSLFGMCSGMVGLGTYFMIVETDGYIVAGFMNYLPLISLILFIYCYIIGIGNLMFVVTTELFDGPCRAIGFSICLIPSALITFLISKYFAQITSAIGPALTYFFFATMCILVNTLIVIFLPETKGKTFNEIQTELDEKLVHIQCTSKKRL